MFEALERQWAKLLCHLLYPQGIQVKASDEERRKVFAVTQKQWASLGETEPYWSVLVDEAFKKKNIHKTGGPFYDSGKSILETMDNFAAKHKFLWPKGVCLELGCGVGRLTQHLAGRFARVVGVDISEGNLRLCVERMRELRLNHVEARLLPRVEDVEGLERCDVFVSCITLQHNAPPVQLYLLEKILQKINPGGYCIFQLVTQSRDYFYRISGHLSRGKRVMDMHCLPMRHVLGLLKEQKFTVLEVAADNSCGPRYKSFLFLARKD